MKTPLKTLLIAAGLMLAGAASAQVTFFEHDGFRGRHFTADGSVRNFADIGFNDRASSVSVRGGEWQICVDADFHGHCIVLQPGDYPSLNEFGLNDKISSVRPMSAYGRYDRGDRQTYRSDEERRWDRRNDSYDSQWRERYREDWDQSRDRNYYYRP